MQGNELNFVLSLRVTMKMMMVCIICLSNADDEIQCLSQQSKQLDFFLKSSVSKFTEASCGPFENLGYF